MPQFLKALYGPAFHCVSPDPEGEPDGGGTDDHDDTIPDDTSDDSPLGEQGQKALTAERTKGRQLKREAESLKRQLAALKGSVSPEDFQAAKDAADAAQREAEAKGQELAKERERLSRKHQQDLKVSNDRFTAAETLLAARTTEFLAKEIFYSVGGDESVDDAGISSFKAFMALKGHGHLRVRDNDELYVIDKAGDELLDDKGKPVTVKDWITLQANTSPVLARLFKPRAGEGSGAQSSNGIRGVRGPDLSKLSHNQLMDAAWPDA